MGNSSKGGRGYTKTGLNSGICLEVARPRKSMPNIFILLFAFGVISKKLLPNKMLQIIFAMLSSKNIIVLGFTFMSLIYFHKIVVYNAR